MRKEIYIGSCLLILLICCDHNNSLLRAPAHFPSIKIPADNQVNAARIQLGKALFFDKSLSRDSTISCETCHQPDLAFSDGHQVSLGIGGRKGNRNAPSLVNAAYRQLFNRDGGVTRLDLQALVPIEDEHEMGISIVHLVNRLKTDPEYQQMSLRAYGDSLSAFVITRALATFVRTIISGDSPYDRFINGEKQALSSIARKGFELFKSERLHCIGCHHGFDLTNDSFENNGVPPDGLDLGRALITLDSADQRKFRVPSLRNVMVTSPYMHDGSLPNIGAVLDHYEQVGQHPVVGQSKKLRSFALNSEERSALVAFFTALTDTNFATDQSSGG